MLQGLQEIELHTAMQMLHSVNLLEIALVESVKDHVFKKLP